MAAQIYNIAKGAFEDAPTPQIYDASAQTYKDSVGLVYDQSKGAWVERWNSFIKNMPESITSGKTSGGSTGAVLSASIDISKYHKLSGTWKVMWCENSQWYPNYQQGYGQIVADTDVLFDTGNCTYANQTYQESSEHYKKGRFSIDVAKYKSLCVKAVATKSYSNWYHCFTISDLVWE